MNTFKILSLAFLFGLFSISGFSQEKNADGKRINPCYQDATEKLKLIEEAEQNQFNVKYVEILGNTYTRYGKFRSYMVLEEGDIFRKRNLLLTIQGFNKVRTIFPIKLENVEVRLDREDKTINLTFCVIQRKKN